MESDDDYQQTPLPEEQPSSPVPERKLKRLKKKASRVSDPIPSDPIPSPTLRDSAKSSDPEPSEPADELTLTDSVGNTSEIQALEDDGRAEDYKDSPPNELNELFDYKAPVEDEMIVNAEGEDEIKKNQESISNSNEKLKWGAKKKTNKRSKKSVDDKGKAETSIRQRKKLEKERQSHLQELHAESQRLLRETRDAEFKPVPLVQKPISSILEKIRQRKLEVSKKVNMFSNHATKEDMSDLYSKRVDNDNAEDKQHVNDVETEMHQHEDIISADVTVTKNSGEPATIPCSSENICSSTALDKDSKSEFRAPLDDTQDLFDDSEQSDTEDSHDSEEENPLEEFAPSVLTMNLKLDSAPIDDASQESDDSDEENGEKENIEPHPRKQIDKNSNPKCDPVKAFVDDEAEEEGDSDNDLMHLKDNEEEENEDTEEFNDLIVTGYEEKPSDNVKRDQLHQMWLEQQDATATDNVLQRLKCNENQRVPIALEEVEDEDDGDFSDDSMDAATDDLHPGKVARINSKKMKQMIPQMFTDKDDVYLSSDDEETEQKLVKMRLLEKAQEKHTSLISPAEDENSRGVFGLIRKLNVAPDPKKKLKPSSFFDTSLITGGNSNSSSKSSFLGRASSCSLPSFSKNGSSNYRSFIFSRDDSNSRSGITATEDSSDMGEKPDLPTKTTRAKFSGSQSKVSSQSTSQTGSNSSLLEVLRRSTQTDQSVRNNSIAQTQVAVQFAAFKSVKKSIKTKT